MIIPLYGILLDNHALHQIKTIIVLFIPGIGSNDTLSHLPCPFFLLLIIVFSERSKNVVNKIYE